jgi:O-antigen ligase
MNSNDFLYVFLALGGAAALGLAGIFAFGLFIDIQTHFHKWLLALLYPIIILAMSIGSILSNRNVALYEFEMISSETGTAVITWFFRIITAFILGICLARLVSVSQRFENRGRQGRTLFLAFLFFYLTNVVLNNIFGAQPAFEQRFLYALILVATVYFSRNQNRYFSTEAMKWGLLFFLAASCIATLVIPTIAVQNDYEGYLPGISIRLWGLGSNPNSIGPLSVVFLLLIAHKPFKRIWIQYPAVLIGVGTLLLSQSKTAWIAALISFSIFWGSRVIYFSASKKNPARSPYELRNFAGPILLCLIGIFLVIGIAVFNTYEQRLTTVADAQQITTLTGRTEIWSIAIDTWKNNPVFGYGSSIWNTEFRNRIGISAALSAHSQFLQALSEAGTIGLLGLIIYLVALGRYAYSANRETRGLSLALFLVILVRAFTETPLDITTIFSGEFVTQLLLFRLVLLKNQKQETVAYSRQQQQLRWG